MANASTLHQLRAAAQYQGEGAQRFVSALSSRLYAERLGDGFTFAKSNAYTTTATAIKASAAHLYGVIIEPATGTAPSGTTGTGGNGYLQIYNAATITDLVPGGGTAITLTRDVLKFLTAMTRCVLFDPGIVDNTSLYDSGICIVVATTPAGSTAVATLPTVTICYA
jgi:hypothetical protein